MKLLVADVSTRFEEWEGKESRLKNERTKTTAMEEHIIHVKNVRTFHTILLHVFNDIDA